MIQEQAFRERRAIVGVLRKGRVTNVIDQDRKMIQVGEDTMYKVPRESDMTPNV